jgi:hypothetical protein
MTDEPYRDGQVNEAVKFGKSLDARTTEGNERATQRHARIRRLRVELEALRIDERSWSLWGAILGRFRRA